MVYSWVYTIEKTITCTVLVYIHVHGLGILLVHDCTLDLILQTNSSSRSFFMQTGTCQFSAFVNFRKCQREAPFSVLTLSFLKLPLPLSARLFNTLERPVYSWVLLVRVPTMFELVSFSDYMMSYNKLLCWISIGVVSCDSFWTSEHAVIKTHGKWKAWQLNQDVS